MPLSTHECTDYALGAPTDAVAVALIDETRSLAMLGHLADVLGADNGTAKRGPDSR